MKKYIIVNADDFGYYKAADEGIMQSMKNGIVKSVTVVANMPYAEQTASYLNTDKTLRHVSVGLHVNLTHGMPAISGINSLTDESGNFCLTPDSLAECASLHDIENELRAQIKRFEQLFARKPSHLDSHKHIHRKCNVLSAVIEAAHELRLPVRANSPYVRERLIRAGIATTDYFIGDVSVVPFWTKEKLITTLRNLPEGVTELMCHPGYTDKIGEYIGFYNAQREGELTALCDDEVKQIIRDENIELISFQLFMKS